jgi:hypothetical protein
VAHVGRILEQYATALLVAAAGASLVAPECVWVQGMHAQLVQFDAVACARGRRGGVMLSAHATDADGTKDLGRHHNTAQLPHLAARFTSCARVSVPFRGAQSLYAYVRFFLCRCAVQRHSLAAWTRR